MSTTRLIIGGITAAVSLLTYRNYTAHQRKLLHASNLAKHTMTNIQSVHDLVESHQSLRPTTIAEILTFWDNVQLSDHADLILSSEAYSALIIELHRSIKHLNDTTAESSDTCNKAFDQVVDKILTACVDDHLETPAQLAELLLPLSADFDASRIGLDNTTLQSRITAKLLEKGVDALFCHKADMMNILSNPGINNYVKQMLLSNEKIRAVTIQAITCAHDLAVIAKVSEPCCSNIASLVLHDLNQYPDVIIKLQASVGEMSSEQIDGLFKSLQLKTLRGAPTGLTQVEFLELMDNKQLDQKVIAESQRMRKESIIEVESILYLEKKYREPKPLQHPVPHLTSADTLTRYTQQLSAADVDINELIALWSGLNLQQNRQLLTCKIDYAMLIIEVNRMAHGNFDTHGFDEVEYDVFNARQFMDETNTALKTQGEWLMTTALSKIMEEFKSREMKSASDIVELLELVSLDTHFFGSAMRLTPHHFKSNLQAEVLRNLGTDAISLLVKNYAALTYIFNQPKLHDSCRYLLKNPLVQVRLVESIKSAEDLQRILQSSYNYTVKANFIRLLATAPNAVAAINSTMTFNCLSGIFKELYDSILHNSADAQIELLTILNSESVSAMATKNLKSLTGTCAIHASTQDYLLGQRMDEERFKVRGKV